MTDRSVRVRGETYSRLQRISKRLHGLPVVRVIDLLAAKFEALKADPKAGDFDGASQKSGTPPEGPVAG